MDTEPPMFPVPRRPVLGGIALLAFWAALSAGFVVATAVAPGASTGVSPRPGLDTRNAVACRLEVEDAGR